MRKIPYGRQHIDADDIQAVTKALQSDYLTTGPCIGEFENTVAQYCKASYGVAVASGTAALHAAMHTLGIRSGDEVIVPAMTFVASANCILYQGGTPVFADVDPATLLISPKSVEELITDRTKAIIGVDYAGHPCDWHALHKLADRHGIALVADSCHALGATFDGQKVGTLADMTVFSFHPVKHIATGEGGMILTSNTDYANNLRQFRNHGITTDARTREESGQWFYEMVDLGYNYRMTDIQAALGSSQMRKLADFLDQRRRIATRYDESFADTQIEPLTRRHNVEHAYHLYVVRIPERDKVYKALRKAGIFAQVHYIPAHLHPYYQRELNTGKGMCPVAEKAYGEILSLPMYPALSESDQEYVSQTLIEITDG